MRSPPGKDADKIRLTPTVGVCRRMSAFVGVCRRLSAYVGVLHFRVKNILYQLTNHNSCTLVDDVVFLEVKGLIQISNSIQMYGLLAQNRCLLLADVYVREAVSIFQTSLLVKPS